MGIAAVGVLSAGLRRSRTLMVFALALLLAWLSTLARVAMFVFLVGIGWTEAVDDGTWHALLGLLVFMPFALVLIGVLIKTHVPPQAWPGGQIAPGRCPVAVLALPLLAVHLLFGRAEETEFPAPPFFASAQLPPGHRLALHAPSEETEKMAYGTKWLLNARFAADEQTYFDLFHYVTRSRSHLCVHKQANCLHSVSGRCHYADPVVIDGRTWWRMELDAEGSRGPTHVYFAFEVGGQRRDDSAATQFAVLRQRALGGSWDVRFTRVMFPGAMPATPSAYDSRVLAWLGEHTEGPN
jgi:hypothetical protein